MPLVLPPDFAQRLFEGVRHSVLMASMERQWQTTWSRQYPEISNEMIGKWLGDVFGQMYMSAGDAARGKEDIQMLFAFAELVKKIQETEGTALPYPILIDSGMRPSSWPPRPPRIRVVIS